MKCSKCQKELPKVFSILSSSSVMKCAVCENEAKELTNAKNISRKSSLIGYFKRKQEERKYNESRGLYTLGATIFMYHSPNETVELYKRLSKGNDLPEYIRNAFFKTDGLKDSSEQALVMFTEAIIVCSQNIEPYWQAIAILHSKNRNREAFALYSKMPNRNISESDVVLFIPPIIGMLFSIGKIRDAENFFIGSLHGKRQKEHSYGTWDMFLDGVAAEILGSSFNKSFENCNEFIGFVLGGVCGDFMTEVEKAYFKYRFAEKLGWMAKSFVNKDIKEASKFIDVALKMSPLVPPFLSDLKHRIYEDLEEEKKWDSINSDDEFLRYLFRRLAFRFHPDLVTDEKDREEKTKVMSDINQAYSDKNLNKLKEIGKKHVPKWIKYL